MKKLIHILGCLAYERAKRLKDKEDNVFILGGYQKINIKT